MPDTDFVKGKAGPQGMTGDQRISGPHGREILVDIQGLHTHFHTSDAVSFTHLRDHEPVLDLVCRLLPEQKQHNTPESRQPHIA